MRPYGSTVLYPSQWPTIPPHILSGFGIAFGLVEDKEGQPWLCHAQRGWIPVARDSRATVAARKVRLLLRFRKDPRAMRIASRMGVYAVHALQLGYAP